MSYAIDANLLVYASETFSPFHRRAAGFLDVCRKGPELMCLTWNTIMAYLRLITHPSIVTRPLSPDRAMENIDAILGLPHVRVVSELEGFWSAYRQTTRGLVARGNLVPDAHLATILRQNGIRTLYTNDTDFRRFAFLEVRNPFA